jgi:uncharacterized protein YgiM (DUF1202 family)
MKKQWLAIWAMAAALPAGVAAQDGAKASGQDKVAYEKRSYPFEGEVSVERLNVRLFPKTDGASIITSVLGQGEKITVVGEKDDYFQILPPKGSTVWVASRSIRKDGDKAFAAFSDVPVRLDSRVNADVLASLKEGDEVKIVAENMGWYKIQAPAAVKFFVGRKYVRGGSAVEAGVANVAAKKDEAKAAPKAPGEDAQALATLAVADSYLDEETRKINEKRLKDVDFTRVVSAYESALGQAQTAPVKARAESGLKRYRDLSVIWETTKAQMAAQEAKRRDELEALSKPAKEEPKGPLMQGYIDTTGILFKRPGTHKLVMGGKIVCFLRSKDGDEKMLTRFNDHYGRMVGVNGTLIKNPEGWEGYSVVVVDEVVPVQ